MSKVLGLFMLVIAAGSVASAQFLGSQAIAAQAPEIDPALGMSAFTVLGGAILIIRARRRKQ
jgi:hypothetical protein